MSDSDLRAALDRLAAEHHQIDDLCERMLAAVDVGNAARIGEQIGELARVLPQHLDHEEMHLLPDILATELRDARLLVEEHRYLRSRLASLHADGERGKLRNDELRAFVDELRAHTAHEEAMFERWAENR
jgi:hemerythrin superfamily protein